MYANLFPTPSADHLRTQMAFINLTGYGRETPIQVDRILYGSLQYIRLPLFQRLLSCVVDLIDMYVARKSGPSRQLVDAQTYINFETRIGGLWLQYVDEAADADTLFFWEDISTGTMYFRDAFTALVVAYFSAARILLGVIAPPLANLSSTLSNHCFSILQASQYMQTHTVGCAYMRMTTPLLLVALHSPESSQRRQATACFEIWMKRSMSGISALALNTIHRHGLRKHHWTNSRTEIASDVNLDLDTRASLSSDKSTVEAVQTTNQS
jgi:hypothetical protein